MSFRILHLLIVFSFFIWKKGHNQNDSALYFIMAFEDDFERVPNRYQTSFSEYDKILYRLDADTLALVDTLNATNGLRMKMLMHYPEQKLIYFEEIDLLGGREAEVISVLDYKEGLALRRFKPDWDTTFQGYTLAIVPLLLNNELVFNNERTRRDNSYTDYGRDRFFNKYRLAPQDFQNIVMPGFSGLQRSGPGGFAYSFVKGNFSQMKITRTLNFSRMPAANIQLPDSLKNYNDPHVWVLINNERYFLGTGTINYTEASDSIRELWVYDKRRSSWKSILLPGLGTSKFMNYEDWLYGVILKSSYHLSKNPSYKDSVMYFYNKYKDRYSKQYGSPPDFVPLCGKLFLCHLPTNSLIIWDAGDLDAEVISISGHTVFYRVFDEIRAVELDENNLTIDWATDRILVKDQERIPYVHWMFFAPLSKIEEVWVNEPEK